MVPCDEEPCSEDIFDAATVPADRMDTQSSESKEYGTKLEPCTSREQQDQDDTIVEKEFKTWDLNKEKDSGTQIGMESIDLKHQEETGQDKYVDEERDSTEQEEEKGEMEADEDFTQLSIKNGNVYDQPTLALNVIEMDSFIDESSKNENENIYNMETQLFPSDVAPGSDICESSPPANDSEEIAFVQDFDTQKQQEDIFDLETQAVSCVLEARSQTDTDAATDVEIGNSAVEQSDSVAVEKVAVIRSALRSSSKVQIQRKQVRISDQSTEVFQETLERSDEDTQAYQTGQCPKEDITILAKPGGSKVKELVKDSTAINESLSHIEIEVMSKNVSPSTVFLSGGEVSAMTSEQEAESKQKPSDAQTTERSEDGSDKEEELLPTQAYGQEDTDGTDEDKVGITLMLDR